MQIACLGSRDILPDAASACREIGMELARMGYTIVTGATPGVLGRDEWAGWADGAFATGVYHSDPGRLIVCLPWRHFPHGSSPPPDLAISYPDDHPQWAEATRDYWETVCADTDGPWQAVRRATRLRSARTAGVLLQTKLLLAWPGEGDEEMRFALGFAAWRKLPTIDLTAVSWREVVEALRTQTRTGLGASALPPKDNTSQSAFSG